MFTRNHSISKQPNPNENNLSLGAFEFFEALNNMDIDEIKKFFNDPNLNIWQVKDENNCTPLHISVSKNNYDLTSLLIEEVKKKLGLDTKKMENFINEKNSEGNTALYYAIINGNINIIKLLRESGAKTENITNSGKNLIHIAAISDQTSIMIYFLLYEAQDITFVDENGSTPLHLACYYNAEDSANYLLSLGVNIDAQDNEKFTPLHLAVSNNRINIAKLLLQKGANKNIVNKYNELPVDIARKKNYRKLFNILNNKDYNPLCTLELPNEYIEPKDIYKKFIFLMILIPEIIISILVLPFLENIIYYFISFIIFALCLFNYFILLKKNPGYLRNIELLNRVQEERVAQPLKILIDENNNLKKYCPTCYVMKGYNIKHCFICNKCVLEMSHHCFWLNKCIGKNNLTVYILFIFNLYLYAFYSLFICTYLISDTVNIPYRMKYIPSWFYLSIDRGFRVLGAAIVSLFSGISSLFLFFLLMIEVFKKLGLLGKKKEKQLIINDNNKDGKIQNNTGVELENQANKQPLLDDENNNIINEKKEKNNNINIPEENFPIVDERPSNIN